MLTPLEREAAAAAAACGAPVATVPGVEAWPVFDHHWLRVIVIASGESVRSYCDSRVT